MEVLTSESEAKCLQKKMDKAKTLFLRVLRVIFLVKFRLQEGQNANYRVVFLALRGLCSHQTKKGFPGTIDFSRSDFSGFE